MQIVVSWPRTSESESAFIKLPGDLYAQPSLGNSGLSNQVTENAWRQLKGQKYQLFHKQWALLLEAKKPGSWISICHFQPCDFQEVT